MADNILADLTLKIAANTAELKEGLKSASTSVNKFSKTTKTDGDNVKKSFSSIKDGVASMASSVTGHLDSVTGHLGSMGSNLPAIITGISGMTKGMGLLKVAIAGTGIGLLVIALAALITYFTQTQEGMDLMKKGFNAVQAVVTVFVDRLGYLGRAIVKLFSGDFAGAAEEAKKAVSGVGDAVASNFKKSQKISDAEAKLEKDKIEFLTRSAQLELDISEKLRIAKDRETYSEKERLAAVKEAQKLQKTLSNEKIALAEEELRIKKELDSLGENTNEDNRQTAILQANVIRLRKEENDKIRELLEKELEANNLLNAKNKEHAAILKARQEELNLIKKKQELEAQAGSFQNLQAKGTIKIDTTTDILPAVNMQMVEVQKAVTTTQIMAMEKLSAVKESIAETTQAVAAMIESTIETAITSFAEMIGEMVAGDGTGLDRFLKGILAMILDFAKQFGTILISMGVAKVALENLGISGVGAVVAGAALVAAATAMQALLSKGIDAKANGGWSNGGLTMVGERGPELVNLPAGAHVTRANRTEQLLSNANNIQVTINSQIRGEHIYQAVQEVTRKRGNTR